MADSESLQFKIANIDKELEKDLNIGIFQFEDYMAFYINLTAYEEYLNSKGSTNVLFSVQSLPFLFRRSLIPLKSYSNRS